MLRVDMNEGRSLPHKAHNSLRGFAINYQRSSYSEKINNYATTSTEQSRMSWVEQNDAGTDNREIFQVSHWSNDEAIPSQREWNIWNDFAKSFNKSFEAQNRNFLIIKIADVSDADAFQ